MNIQFLAPFFALVITVAAISNGNAAESSHRLGIGAHYWVAIESIDDEDFDENGLSWVATYQFKPGLFGIGVDVGWKEKGFGGSADDVYEPQAYLVVGRGLYGAAGVGWYYTDGDFSRDPFYFFRAGLDLELIGPLSLDIHAVYRFEAWNDLSAEDRDIDTDTVTLGAALRLSF